MSGIVVRTINGEFAGELDRNIIGDTIWLSLPKTYYVNMLGGMMYFECPLDFKPEGELVTKLKKGDIAYWPKADAFCIFFGSTPLSGDDGEPVAPYPVIVIGKMAGDCSGLYDAGDRQRVILDRGH